MYASAGKTDGWLLKYRSLANACLNLVLSMMPSRLIAVVLLGLVVASASAQDESLADKNKDDIVKHEDILKDKVATDLQELKTKIKQFVENVNSKLTELRTKTKEAIKKSIFRARLSILIALTFVLCQTLYWIPRLVSFT